MVVACTGTRRGLNVGLCGAHREVVLGVLKLSRDMLSVNHHLFNVGGVDDVLGVRASANLQTLAVAAGGYAGDGSASFHISAGVSVHKSGCIGLLAVHRHFRRVGCLEKDEFHGRVGVFTPNLLHMPGVRVAGQRERAAPFRFVTFEQRSKMGQTG